VPFTRPAELSRDDTVHFHIMKHAVEWMRDRASYSPDLVMLLQPTSPLRTADDIRRAVRLIESSGADSVVSVSEVPSHYNRRRTRGRDEPGWRPLSATAQPVRRRINRRQDMPHAWTMNGAIYLFRTRVLFAAEPSLYGDRTAAYVMPG